MSRPYSYATRFVTGVMDPKAEAITMSLEAVDYPRNRDGSDAFDLLLRQHLPFGDDEEGRLNRAGLHRLVDAWLDGVEFKG